MTGRFISFEGTEGVGKTTAIDRLCERLDKQGIEWIRTREPGGSELGEHLRSLFLNPDQNMNSDTEILLMFAARADHLQKVILPALQAGKWVICDRFTDSTMAYQGFGRGCGEMGEVDKINLLIEQFVPKLPDVTLWLDLDIATGIRRAGKRGTADRIEANDLAFFERVYQGYAYQQNKDPKRICRIDADGTPEQIGERIAAALGLA